MNVWQQWCQFYEDRETVLDDNTRPRTTALLFNQTETPHLLTPFWVERMSFLDALQEILEVIIIDLYAIGINVCGLLGQDFISEKLGMDVPMSLLELMGYSTSNLIFHALALTATFAVLMVTLATRTLSSLCLTAVAVCEPLIDLIDDTVTYQFN